MTKSAIELALEALRADLNRYETPGVTSYGGVLVAAKIIETILAHFKSLHPVAGEGVREAYAEICNSGFLSERDPIHGGGYRVIFGSKPEGPVYHKEDEAQAALGLLRADAILALSSPAPQPQQGCPEGYVLVPVEPTEAMLAVEVIRETGGKTYDYSEAAILQRARRDIYRAMLNASPSIVDDKDG